MRDFKRIVVSLFAIFLLMVGAGAISYAEPVVRISSVSLGVKKLSVDPRLGTYQFSARVRPSNATYQTKTWKSSNEAVASVDQNGLLTLHQTGTTLVSVRMNYGGKSAACKVTVALLPIKKVLVSPAKTTLKVGSSRQMTASVSPIGTGDDKTILWSVDPGYEQILSVNESGTVTALKAGTGYVRATSGATGGYARCKVLVTDVAVTRLSLSSERLVLNAQETSDVLSSVTVLPAEAAYRPVTYVSSNPQIVSVDANGKVTANKAGDATIIAKCGTKKALCKVHVRGSSFEIMISAAGDVTLGGDPRNGEYPDGTYLVGGVDYKNSYSAFEALYTSGQIDPFKNVAKYFKGVNNISIVNAEASITRSNNAQNASYSFKSNPDRVQLYRESEIEIVNIANNHTGKFGQAGFQDTVRNLRSAGIGFCDKQSINAIYVASGPNGLSAKIGVCGFQTPVSTSAIRSRVRTLKKKGCDMVIVNFHFCHSASWVSRPNYPGDSRYAHTAIDAGADLVLGHHRHVICGLETYKGKMIVYDMGNLVAGVRHVNNNDSFIYRQRFTIDETGYVEPGDFEVIPCKTTSSTQTYATTNRFGEMGAPIANWEPVVLEGSEAQRVLSKLQSLSPNVTIPGIVG